MRSLILLGAVMLGTSNEVSAQSATARVCGTLDLSNAELTRRPLGDVLSMALSNRCTKLKIYTSGATSFAGRLVQVGSQSLVLDTAAAGATKPALMMITLGTVSAIAFD